MNQDVSELRKPPQLPASLAHTQLSCLTTGPGLLLTGGAWFSSGGQARVMDLSLNKVQGKVKAQKMSYSYYSLSYILQSRQAI